LKLLIIDNYDSFTFNIVHYAEPYVQKISVFRNDALSVEDVEKYDAVILSPGPGTTEDTGVSMEVVRRYAKTKKILGVCMGMQVIAVVFGAALRNLDEPLHGVAVPTFQTEVLHSIFKGIPKEFRTGRYHSWVIDERTLPDDLLVTAIDTMGLIQAIRHREYPLTGVQFHPESVLTEYGKLMIQNWIQN